jgi:hypothetical protein
LIEEVALCIVPLKLKCRGKKIVLNSEWSLAQVELLGDFEAKEVRSLGFGYDFFLE